MNSILLLLLFFAAGFLWRWRMDERLRRHVALVLNRYVVYVALPSLVLVYLPGLDLNERLLLPVASAWGIFLLSAAIVLLTARLAAWSRRITGALLFTVPLGNTSFLGVPFTLAYFGEKGLAFTLVYDQLGSFLILSTVGVALLALFAGKRFEPRRIFWSILRFPAFIALAFSLFLDEGSLPGIVHLPLSWLAATLSPAAMIAVGLQLRLSFPRHERAPFLFALGVKLFLSPVLLLGLFSLLGYDDLAARVSIFESAMAPMVSSSTLAILAGLEAQFVASVLGYGILASFLTLPMIFWLIQHLL